MKYFQNRIIVVIPYSFIYPQDGADKQLGIEKKLHEIDQIWSKEEFEFSTFKERGEVILAGARCNETIELLEDSQASLGQV